MRVGEPTPRTVVYQLYQGDSRPAWIDRCLASVGAWAGQRGYDYRFYSDRLDHGMPDWYLKKMAARPDLRSEVSRCLLAKELFIEGYERTVWFDADALVFDPEALDLPAKVRYAMIPTTWVGVRPDGASVVLSRVSPAVLLCTPGHPFLDFYVHALYRTAANHEMVGDVTIRMLNQLWNWLRFPLLGQINQFSPRVTSDILRGGGPSLAEFGRRAPARVAAADLCQSFRNREHDGVTNTDADYGRLIDRCLESRGEVVNGNFPGR